jgi:hypothetical protein
MRVFNWAVLPLLALVGCARSISIALPHTPLTIMVYSQGKVSQRCAIAPGSDKFRKLGQLLQANAAGWHSRSADYMPSIVVIGSDLNLYFVEDSVIVSETGGEYSRTIPADSYRFLECTYRG